MSTQEEMELDNPSLLQLPVEIQALTFSYATLTDIKSISVTCHYYRLNVWALIVTLDPTSLTNMVLQAADVASSDYIDDLFSEPDPRLIEVLKVQQIPVFHKIFQQVDLSRRKFDKFVLQATDGFADIKEDFFSGLEAYPSFIQQITSLTAIHIRADDLARFLKLTPHVQHLDWQVLNFPFDLKGRLLPSITSLVLRGCTCMDWNFLIWLSRTLPSLTSLDFVDCTFYIFRSPTNFLDFSLQRVGFLNSKFANRYALGNVTPTLINVLANSIKYELPALKVLDLRGSVAVTQFCNVWAIQQQFPDLEIILGLYIQPSTHNGDPTFSLFTCEGE